MAKATQRSKAAGGRLRDDGRPVGAPNKRSGYVRNTHFTCRMTEGMDKTMQALIDLGLYKTRADVLHDAVQLLGNKKLTTKVHRYWLTQIQ